MVPARLWILLLPVTTLSLLGCSKAQVLSSADAESVSLVSGAAAGSQRPEVDSSDLARPGGVALEILKESPAPLIESLPGETTVAQVPETPADLFPTDAGGALLKKMLPPRVALPDILRHPHQPKVKSGPAEIENPSGMKTPALTSVVRLAPLGTQTAPGPRIQLPESLPDLTSELATPSSVELSVGKKVTSNRLDVSGPLDLPSMAPYTPDRASLEDATRQPSLEAVLIAPIPVRAAVAPFVRQSIPDPFENRRVVQFQHPELEPIQPLSKSPSAP